MERSQVNVGAVKEQLISLFWHVYLVNKWRPIIAEQLLLLQASELLSRTEVVWVSLIGEDLDRRTFRDLTRSFKQLVIGSELSTAGSYEYPAIQAVYDWSLRSDVAAICLYFHTKGISYADERHSRWRDILNDGVILNWTKHIHALNEGYDLSGQNYLNSDRFAPHFSGNFWFARAGYLASLVDPRHLDQRNRYNAEAWVCSRPHTAFSLPFIEPNPDSI